LGKITHLQEGWLKMSLFERVSELAKKQGKSLNRVAEDNGLSKNAIYQWRTSSPKAETLELIANYFHVSTDYLLGRTDNPHMGMSEKQKEMTIEEALKSVMSYNGKEVSENDRQVLERIAKAYLDGKI
jgi:transcriptional regulator with XRE-family HTH domain